MRQLILASASPRRRQLLGLLNIGFQVIPARGEEVLDTSDPVLAVRELSRQKAAEVAGWVEGEALVIGADTVVALGGEILGKPTSREHAFAMLAKLQGNTHSVFTGVTLLEKEGQGIVQSRTFVEETRVAIGSMTDRQIWEYINRNESMDKAGAYAIQGPFGVFVQGIAGDYNNVVGLPLSRLYRELLEMGTDLLEEWRNP